ncbi:unnamed protein product, partial [Mesorhabditis spiculigera]
MFLRTVAKLETLAQSSLDCSKLARLASFSTTRAQRNDVSRVEQPEIKVLDIPLKAANGARLSGEQFLGRVRESLGVNDKDDWALSSKDVTALANEYDAALTDAADLKDKYQRALAEVENVRRRGVKQTEDAKSFAIQGFCKDMLEVADILDLAVNSVPKEELNKEHKAFKDLYSGISMTKTVLLKTFASHGLSPIDPTGQKFDPNLHEAICELPAQQTGAQPGHVVQVAKIGYQLKGRPIRAAQVVVAKSDD